MNFVSDWMNSNELRAYPIEPGCQGSMPDTFLSDMCVFSPYPSEDVSGIETSNGNVFCFGGVVAPESRPCILAASVTKHIVSVVVKCPGCHLFCTRSLDSVVPYEPIELVSETGAATGWLAFGSFDKSKPFSFRHKSGSSDGLIDPRAVVTYPVSTIGGFRTGYVSGKISGDVVITGGPGIESSIDEKTNSIVLSLDPDTAESMSDPCSPVSGKSLVPACSINGVRPDASGFVTLAFTGKEVKEEPSEDVSPEPNEDCSLAGILNAASTGQETAHPAIRASAERTLAGNVMSVAVSFHHPRTPVSNVVVSGYRLVFVPSSAIPGALQRDLEFSIHSGYHMPGYDLYSRDDLLPAVAEVYRHVSGPNVTISDPYKFTEELKLREEHPGDEIKFVHRFKLKPEALDCAVYAEIVYRAGEADSRTMKIDVPLSGGQSLIADSDLEHRVGYESKHVESVRYPDSSSLTFFSNKTYRLSIGNYNLEEVGTYSAENGVFKMEGAAFGAFPIEEDNTVVRYLSSVCELVFDLPAVVLEWAAASTVPSRIEQVMVVSESAVILPEGS